MTNVTHNAERNATISDGKGRKDLNFELLILLNLTFLYLSTVLSLTVRFSGSHRPQNAANSCRIYFLLVFSLLLTCLHFIFRRMSIEHENNNVLLGVIPSKCCLPKQVARWYEEGDSPNLTYRLLRTPVDLDEFNDYNCRLAIWRENGTLTYLTPFRRRGEHEHLPTEDDPFLILKFSDEGPFLGITGRDFVAMVETIAFFMNLEGPATKSSAVTIDTYGATFLDFHNAGVRCFMGLFETAPFRSVTVGDFTLSEEQSIVLATRPHPVQLTFCGTEFEDEGTVFVDALVDRRSSLVH
jgi:hypothetical protein